MRLLVLIILLSPCMAFAQIVTASFDRSILSKNPASATTRDFSQVALFDSFRTSDSNIDELRSDSSVVPWQEKIKMNKLGLYATGHGKFSPEIYISRDTAEKTLSLDDVNDEKQTSKINLINNMVNLGLRLTRDLSVGVKVFAPSLDYTEKFEVNYEDGKSLTFNNKVKNTTLGIGGGVTYQFRPNLYLGGYFTRIKEKVISDITFTDIDGVPQNSNSEETFDHTLKGAGFSYLKGSRGRGFRFEAAYSVMTHPEELLMEDGEEFYTAIEFSHRRFTFGGHIKYRKNVYFENIELLDYVSGDKNFSEKFTPSYGGFLSFGSGKGSTIGISGMIYKTGGTRQLFGQEQKAETAVSEITLTYAYLF